MNVVISPYCWYGGILPTYIDRSYIAVASPRVVYVDTPVYVNDTYVVVGGSDSYYLHPRSVDDQWRNEPDLKRTVLDLEEAFLQNDSSLLSRYADPDTKIAIFSKGHYEYSLDSNDYLTMTRDFMQTARTTAFDVYRVRNKTSGVYQAFVKHTYLDQDDQSRTVYLCIVLERLAGRWTLTQIDTSPDRIND